jgi:cytochrome c
VAVAARPAHDSSASPTPHAAPDSAPAPAGDSAKSASAAAPAAKPPQQDTSSQPAEAPLIDAYHQPPRDTVSEAVYDGWKQFNLNCARCHGEDALGTTIAPHLILSLKPDGPINTKELFVQTVCAGRPTKGMPSWCALGLGIDKINDIYLYVKGRSDAKISPGRPAVKKAG